MRPTIIPYNPTAVANTMHVMKNVYNSSQIGRPGERRRVDTGNVKNVPCSVISPTVCSDKHIQK